MNPNPNPHAAPQVAFNALIPCMLFTKVGATLAARPDPALLAIPLVAAAQVRRQAPDADSMENTSVPYT